LITELLFRKYFVINSLKVFALHPTVDAYRLKRGPGYYFPRRKIKRKLITTSTTTSLATEWCSMKADVTLLRQATQYRCEPRCSLPNRPSKSWIDLWIPRSFKECHHGFSSQNESMNRLISRYAPKDRTFCQSPLTSRICWPLSRQCRPRQVLMSAFYEWILNSPRNTVIMLGNMGKNEIMTSCIRSNRTKESERTWSS
jgi:hypothetical protein